MGDKLLAILMGKANFRLHICQMINGDIIEFEDKVSLQHVANNPKFTSHEGLLIDIVLKEMLA